MTSNDEKHKNKKFTQEGIYPELILNDIVFTACDDWRKETGLNTQYWKFVEECGEVLDALSSYINFKVGWLHESINNYTHLLDELADSFLMHIQLITILGVEEFIETYDKKLHAFLKRVDKKMGVKK